MIKNKSISVKAFGKLNLMLDIVGRRDDGYHLLKTVMQSVDVYDKLDIMQNDTGLIELICDKQGFPCDSSNLIYKAVVEFRKYTGKSDCGVTVKVEKNLPSMAGMAGGSADCAATLQGLNILFETELSEKELCEIGVKIGADVPFCIVGGTQLCSGIGEKMEKLKAPDCLFVVIKPQVSVSTPAAFKKYDSIANPQHCNTEKFISALQNSDINEMCGNMFNVLDYACSLDDISVAKEKLLQLGAENALMTGSGSAVFGVFTDKVKADFALSRLSEYDYAMLCKPCNKGYEVISLHK